MAELKKHALLLSLLSLLLCVKFVLLPIYQWQEGKLHTVQMLQKKQQKVANILQFKNEEREKYITLKDNVAKGESIFFPYQKESDFKLAQQKLIENLLVKNKVTASNIGWQVTSPLPEYKTINYQLKLQFSGKHLDVVNLIYSFEKNAQRIEIADFNLNIQGQSGDKLGNINGWFIINFYAFDASMINGTDVEGVSS